MTDKVNVYAKVCGLGKRCVIDPTPSEAVPEVPPRRVNVLQAT